MRPIRIPTLDSEKLAELEELYRCTRNVRLRTRAQMVLLSAELGLTAAEIAEIVRTSEETVRRWLKRYLAEGVEGLHDEPQPGAPRKVTEEYKKRLLHAVRRRASPSAQPGVAILTVDLTAAGRLHGRDHEHPGDLRERTGTLEGHGDRLEPSPAHHHQPRPRVRPQKKAIEEARDGIGPGDRFYYADEFNLSWMPTR